MNPLGFGPWLATVNWTRWLIVVLAVVVAVVIIGTLSSQGRDEGSYQYGRGYVATEARTLWMSVTKVGREGSAVHAVGDACRIVVDTSLDMDTARAESMQKMDREDMIAGCTDVLDEEQRLGYLP